MIRGDLSVGIISKATCFRFDSKGIFNKQPGCLITTEIKNDTQSYHCLFTLCSLSSSVAFGHCVRKKERVRIKQALNLRPYPASALVKIRNSPSEISNMHTNKINAGCFQTDLILFQVGRGFHLHNIFFIQPQSKECNHKQGGDWDENAFELFDT